MKKIAKQLKLVAVFLLAVALAVGMAFAVSAEETDAGDSALDLSGVSWVVKGTETSAEGLVYSGEKYTVEPINLPEGVTVTKITGNTATNAGNYTAKATLSYTVEGEQKTSTLSYPWSVAKAVYDMSGVSLNDAALTYNGAEQTLAVTGELPEGVRVSYGTGYVNVGTYTVTATFTGNKNYEAIEPMTATLTIEKAVYDMSGVSFADKTLIYRGVAQSIAIDGTLPFGVRVSYNGSYTEIGEYTVTASFKGDADNYEPIPDMTAVLTIVPATPEDCVYYYKDSTGTVIAKVVASDGIPADTLYVLDNSYLYDAIEISRFYSMNVLASYDLSFSFGGVAQTVNAPLTVTLLVPEALRSNDKLELVHITGEGSLEGIEAERVGDTFVFETNHFSTFAFVEGYSTLAAPEEQLPWWMILLFVLDGISVAFFIVSLCLKPRRPEDDEPVCDTNAPDEEPTADVAEEAPVEEPAEEASAEEAPVEEPVEENFVEESEEDSIEDTEEEPAAPESDEESDESPVADGQVVMVSYRSSFMSRLIQADADIQDYYTVIKNTLLSYKGVKARASWNYESFNKGRIQCAKLNIKGRTLSLYLALAPEEYNATKYHFVDASGNGKFDKVPMMLKIRSDRALKYAVELIEELMKAHGIEAGPAQNVDYRMPYETTEALAERDLVKIILPTGVSIGENDSLIKADVSDVIDGTSGN